MKVTILGCGTSTGVPTLGCDCEVCRSGLPRNQRQRTSALITLDTGEMILIDTTPDLRRQALDHGILRMDAVLYTHCHADHTHGIDELRTFNFLMGGPVNVYGVAEHIDHIRTQFSYIFETGVQRGGGKPNLETHTVTLGKPFVLLGQSVTPLPLRHGVLLSVGWRIGNFAYCTDVNEVPDSTMEKLHGLDVLVLGALRRRRHSTHFSIDEAVQVAQRIGAGRTYLTHMGHDVDYDETFRALAGTGVEPAWDGLTFRIG